jgi:hypothetical protein
MWRTANGESALVDLSQSQGLVQRQRMAGAGLVGLGRHHPHVLAELCCDLAQRVQPRRVDAVVVGQKDAHG